MYILLGLLSILGALWIALGGIFVDPAFGYYTPFATGSILALMASVVLMARRYEKRAFAGITVGAIALLVTIAHIVMTLVPGDYHPTDVLTGTMLPVGMTATVALLLIAPITLLLCKKVEEGDEDEEDEEEEYVVETAPVATVGVVKTADGHGNVLYEVRSDRPYDGHLVAAVRLGGGVIGYLMIAPGQVVSAKRLSPQFEGSTPPSIIAYEEMDHEQARRVTEIPNIPVYEVAPYRSDLPPPTAVLVRV